MYTWFIARRLFRHTENERRVSRPAILIATLGVAVGVCVMILSVCVTLGFQQAIRSKVTGFGAHVQVLNGETVTNFVENGPIVADSALLEHLARVDGVKHVQRFCQKSGMIKTDEAFRGVAFRGVGQEYDTLFLSSHLVEGRLPMWTDSVSHNEILVSSRVASQLKLSLGDRVYAYFFEEKVRARRFTVVGIYNTNLADFDNNLVFTDLCAVRKLWGWQPSQCSGVEVIVNDFGQLESATDQVAQSINHQQDVYGASYLARSILDLYPVIFSWLDLLDMNVWVILALMISVAGFTMVSGLLIIILERTNFIGIMKAMGADNDSIRRIFLCFAMFIILRGLLLGNALALVLMFCQEMWHVVRLNPQDYYMDTVPLCFHWGYIVLIDVCTFVSCVLALLVPSYLISNIHPARSIRFE